MMIEVIRLCQVLNSSSDRNDGLYLLAVGPIRIPYEEGNISMISETLLKPSATKLDEEGGCPAASLAADKKR